MSCWYFVVFLCVLLGVKYSRVVGNDSGSRDVFGHGLCAAEQSRGSLLAAVSRRCAEEALERAARCDPCVEKTALTLLTLVRPFSFS